MKIKMKTKDGEIIDGYELGLQGAFENRFTMLSMILLLPDNKGECPCIFFAKRCYCSKYSFRELTQYPYINIELSDLRELAKLCEKH